MGSELPGSDTKVRVAVLGTGKMGAAIARRLATAGHDVTVWNRTRVRAQQVGVGRVAETAADAASGADVVVSSLTGPDAVRATYAGPSGALEAAHGQVFVEMSTAGPEVVAELAPRVASSGSSLVDAPIIGVPPALERGAAFILAGGDDNVVARVRPILELFGEVRHAGALGNGARLKLVANSMLGVVTLAAAELLAAAESSGLDRDVVFDILARYVPSFEVRRDQFLRGNGEPPLFALRDLRKDLDLALGMYHGAAATIPLTALVRELVTEVAGAAPDADISAVVRRYARPR